MRWMGVEILRWYGTPYNIYKDERNLKSDCNHGFQNFKIYNICPQNAFVKFNEKELKSKTGARFKPATLRLLGTCNSLTDRPFN